MNFWSSTNCSAIFMSGKKNSCDALTSPPSTEPPSIVATVLPLGSLKLPLRAQRPSAPAPHAARRKQKERGRTLGGAAR